MSVRSLLLQCFIRLSFSATLDLYYMATKLLFPKYNQGTYFYGIVLVSCLIAIKAAKLKACQDVCDRVANLTL